MCFPAGGWQRLAQGTVRGIRPPCSQADCTTMATSVSALPPSHKTPALYPCLSRHLYWRWPSAGSEAMAEPLLRDTTQCLLLIPNTPDSTPLHITTLPPHSSSSSTSPVYLRSILKDDIKHILNCRNHSCLKYFMGFFSQWNLLGKDCSIVRRRKRYTFVKSLGFSLRSLLYSYFYVSVRTCWTSLWWMCLPP